MTRPIAMYGSDEVVPTFNLPYLIAPDGAPPYAYESRVKLAGANRALVERLTALLARLAWTPVECPTFGGVQTVEDLLDAYERALRQASATVLDDEARAWIDEFGSRRLQQGVARGYDMRELYMEERLEHAFPGLDSTCSLDGARWRAMREPSMTALETLAMVEAVLAVSDGSARAWIVELEEEPFGFRMFRRPCREAVLVEGWLDRHLVLVGVEPQRVA